MKDYVEMRNGGYYVKGKRVSLDSLVYAFRRGESPESIRESFPLVTLEEVYGGLAFYMANRKAVDESIRKDELAFDREVLEARTSDPAFYEWLDRVRGENLVGQG